MGSDGSGVDLLLWCEQRVLADLPAWVTCGTTVQSLGLDGWMPCDLYLQASSHVIATGAFESSDWRIGLPGLCFPVRQVVCIFADDISVKGVDGNQAKPRLSPNWWLRDVSRTK